MKIVVSSGLTTVRFGLIAGLVVVASSGRAWAQGSVQFEQVTLPTAQGAQFTSVAIGPDGKLYAVANVGEIRRWLLNPDGTTGAMESITSLQSAEGGNRLAVGFAFDPAATSGNLIAWVNHTTFGFSGMSDWGGKITRLSGPNLEIVDDYVVGLPRSSRDHVTNGIDFGPDGALYLTQGSNSSMGAPDAGWADRPERVLNAAVLRFDPSLVSTPPLNVQTEEGGSYDPYAVGAPLTVFGSGTRNAYDLAWHSNGQLYVPTNGSAPGGNTPAGTPGASCADGSTYGGPLVSAETNLGVQSDYLFRVEQGGYYGHPNPQRCEFVMNGGNPTSGVDAAEVAEYAVGTDPDANYRGFSFDFGLHASPNGIIEYKSWVFSGALRERLLVTRYSGGQDIIVLTPGVGFDISASQTGITGFTGLVDPLDLTQDVDTGNIYVSEYGASRLTLLRPIPVGAACSPISTLSCSQVPVTLPYELFWDFDQGGLVDGGGDGTGFTMVDPPTAATGYLPANVDVDTAAGTLAITTTAGIMYDVNNSLDNGFGVAFDADPQTTRIETTLLNLPSSDGNFEQAGLWFFLDEQTYVKYEVLSSVAGTFRLEVLWELNDVPDPTALQTVETLLSPGDDVHLILVLNPTTNEVTASYAINGGGEVPFGTLTVDPSLFSGALLPDGLTGPVSFAGIYATHRNAAAAKVYAFDDFSVVVDGAPPVPPDAPTGLTATAVSATDIDLSWTDNASNETQFEIERSTTGSGGPFSPYDTVGVNVSSYSDNGLASSTQYCYRVRATNGAGSSADSNVDCATTLTPPADVVRVGSWTGETQYNTNGFNYSPGAGSNRIALIMICGESNSNPVANVGTVSLGGQALTAIENANGVVVGSAGGFHDVIWLGYLDESGIGSMSGSALSISWNTAPSSGEPHVQAATYENVDQTTPIADSASNTNTSAGSIQAGSVSVGSGELLVYVTVDGQPANHTAPSGYTEQIELDGPSNHLSNASAERDTTTSSTQNPTASWSNTSRLAIISAVLSPVQCTAPTSDAGVNQTVCETDTVQLAGSATSASGTQWTTSGDGSFDDDGLLNAVYTPGAGDIAAGTVTVTLTANSVCTSAVQDAMDVTIQASSTADAGADEGICETDTVQLAGSATAASSTQWTSGGDGNFDDDTLLNAVYTPGAADIAAGTVTLTLTSNATSPCTGSVQDAMDVTIQASPTAGAGTDQAICETDTVLLAGSASGASSTQWASGGDGSFDDDSLLNAVYTPGAADIAAGTVTLTVTSNATAPCTGTVQDTMDVTIQASPTVDAGADQGICETDTVQLAGSASGASSTQWAAGGDGSFDDDSLLNAVYTPGAADIAAGTVTLTLTSNATSPCTDAVQDAMDVTIQASPTADAGTDQGICESGTVQLAGLATNASSTTWSTAGDGSFDDDALLNAVYTPGAIDIADGSVTLTLTADATSPCTGSGQDAMDVSIQAAPTTDAGSNQSICSGNTVQLAGSAGDASLTTWSTGGDGTFDDNALLDAVYTPGAGDIAAGLVTLTLTADATAPCTGSVQDSMDVAIQAGPTVDAGTNQSICAGNTVQLSGTASDAASTTWSTAGDGTFDDDALLNAVYTPGAGDITAGLVTLTLTADATSPCTGSVQDSMDVAIQAGPAVDAGTNQSICAGNTVQLSGSTSDASSTTWGTGGDGTFDDDASLDAVYTPGAGDIVSGSVTLTLTADATSPCTGSVQDGMDVTFQAGPTVDAGSNQSVCSGDTVQLAGLAGDAASTTWSTTGDGGFDDDSLLNAVYAPGAGDLAAGSVTLTLTADATAPCTGSVQDGMDVTFQVGPTVDAGSNQSVCSGDTVQLAGSEGDATSTTWSTTGDGGFDDDSLLNAVYTPGAADLSAGTVTLTLTADATAPCMGSVQDGMDVTFQTGPTVDAGSDQTVCEFATAQLAGNAGEATSTLWTTNGDGSFDDGGLLNAVYTPGAGDLTTRSVTLMLTANATAPCLGSTQDDMVLDFQSGPAVDAGPNQSVCAGDDVALAGSAMDASSTLWTTAGDGTFDDDSILNAIYTPGAGDRSGGSVTLTLTADATARCTGSVQDTLNVTIQALPLVGAGSNQVICETNTVSLSGSALNTSGTQWGTSGDGLFDDDSLLNAVYTPGAADIAVGTVTLTLTANAISPCTSFVQDALDVTIRSNAATADAGADQGICDSGAVQLAGVANTPITLWSSLGDGFFDDAGLLDAVYTPGVADISTGSVTLILTVNTLSPCIGSDQDSMNVSIFDATFAQIEEVLAGANGDSSVQFIEMKVPCTGDTLWGPQGVELEGRVRLVFYDATGAQTGEFVFSNDPNLGVPDPIHGDYSVLIATETFEELAGMPAPDFIIPPNVLAVDGKVCFQGNPDNPSAPAINLCLSYGNFIDDTEGAGPPSAVLPITDDNSLRRVQDFDNYVSHSNADFALSTPDPRNSAGATGTIVPADLITQGDVLFNAETFYGNGRTCFTCHRPGNGFGLNAATIGLLPPNDPLFVAEQNPILADLENPCLMRGARGLILENIDGFENPPVFRGSPPLMNVAETAPYGHGGDIPDLQTFTTGAVNQHLPKTLARNADPSVGPLDFRLPMQRELEAIEAFMQSIRLPADGDYDLQRMIDTAISRGGDAASIQRGKDLFFGTNQTTSEAKCFLCHSGPTLSHADVTLGGGNQNFDTGIQNLPINSFTDACLGFQPIPAEDRPFSTRSLLGVSFTAPYFHDNSVQTLRAAVSFYNTPEFNASPAALNPLIGEVTMTEADIDDITAFLETLIEPAFMDCNSNTIDDVIDLIVGTSLDCNLDHVPDECQLAGNDCNGNTMPDLCDLKPLEFDDATDFSTGTGAFFLTTADVDHRDGPDLLVAEWTSANVTSYLNDGAGSFTLGHTAPVGSFPKSIALADFNKDGWVDLATASLSASNISILLNNGEDQGAWLGFAAAVSVPVGGTTISVAAGDWNLDGFADIAALRGGTGPIVVVLNSGDDGKGGWLGFAGVYSQYSIGTGTNPFMVVSGNMNADNALDLVVANKSSNNISVMLNDGLGAFATVTNYPVEIAPESVVVADFDGDMIGDVAVPNVGTDTVTVFTNDGTGFLNETGSLIVGAYPFGAGPNSVSASDVDTDGDLDLVVSNAATNNVSIVLNDGTGTLSGLTNLPLANSPDSLVVADYDGDGSPDIATAHFSASTVSLIMNRTPPFGGDCNGNGVPDNCDVTNGSDDLNGNLVPDECESLGDIDGDGDVDTDDLNLLVSVLLGQDTTPAFVGRSDINANGMADGLDIRLFVLVFMLGP